MSSEHRIEPSLDTQSTEEDLHIERFVFTGSGGEYFGIWIVNILLSILTLGIYSAWAKVRNNQYFYGNTVLDDSSFEYTATPMQILRGRIIALVLFVLYFFAESYIPSLWAILAFLLFLASPWIIMKSLAFNAHHSEYRGIKFQFHQSFWDAAKTFILIPIAAFLPAIILSIVLGFSMETGLGIDAAISNGGATSILSSALPIIVFLSFLAAYPFIIYISNRYIICNHAFGGQDFRFRVTSPKPYFWIFLKATAVVLIAMAFFYGIIMLLTPNLKDFAASNSQGLSAGFSLGKLVIYLIVGVAYAFLIAYVKANTYNLAYQNIAIGKHKLRAKVKTADLAILYITNTLGIACTLGIFIPWAKVQTAKFFAANTALQVSGDLASFVATQTDYQNALGEEIGEMFDIDIAL